MAIDPASGAILRLILVADMKPGEFTANSGIEVEYGQVSIGGKDYFLPVRSVTSSLAHSLLVEGGEGNAACPWLGVSQGLQRSLNDVVFKDYHVFRSDATILTESDAAALASQRTPTQNGKNSKQTETNASPVTTTAVANVVPASGSNITQSESTVSNPANSPAPEPHPAAQPAQSIAESATPAPPVPADSASPDGTSAPVFRTTARQVLVDVVVDKKNGDPVSGLPKSDFSIGEDGKPQTIDFFEEHSDGSPISTATPAMPPLPPGAITNVPTAPRSAALYVFLLDSLNTGPQDQVYVRQQILTFLHKLEPGTQVAVFSLGSRLRSSPGLHRRSRSPASRRQPQGSRARCDGANPQ